jgi:lipopolysaccharide biosynthesis glycosyltransferase
MATSNVKIFVDDLTKQSVEYAKAFYNRDYYTNTAWLRLFIPEMYKQYDKVIYLDSDTVANVDIAELFDVDIDGYCAAVATCETCDSFPVFTDYVQKYMGFAMPWYFNSGVLLLNSKVLRQDKFQDKFFELIRKHKFELIQDQDCLNVLFRGRCKFLPQVWNKIPLVKDGINNDNVKIVHYNLVFRPWRYDGIDFVGIKSDTIPFEEIFWKYAKRCPMYEKILADKKAYTDEAKQKDVDMANNLVEIALREVALPREQTWAGLEFMRKVEIGKNL